MTKKSFFKERTVEQIRNMNCYTVRGPRDLVERVQGLNHDDSLLIQYPGLTPHKFSRNSRNSAEASRRNLKHGFYLFVDQPYSIDAARATTEIPMQLRQRALEEGLEHRSEPSTFALGYSFRPIVGKDRNKRIFVPFYSIMEGCKRDTYDQFIKENYAHLGVGSSIETYEDARLVPEIGAEAVVTVPSSTKGKGRYRIKWKHVAVHDSPDKRVIWWGTRPAYEKKGPEHSSESEPLHRVYNVRYGNRSDDEFTYPHDVHAHQALIRHFMRRGNLTPLEGSQYAIPSQEAVAFYTKLCNNVIVNDSTIQAKHKLRKLHIDEKSTMMARFAGQVGAWKSFFWDPERDGRIRDYDWGQEL